MHGRGVSESACRHTQKRDRGAMGCRKLYVALLDRAIVADFCVGDYGEYERYAISPKELHEQIPDAFLLYFESAALPG